MANIGWAFKQAVTLAYWLKERQVSFRKRAESVVAASSVDVVIPKHVRQSAATDQAVQSPTAKGISCTLGRQVPGEHQGVKEQLHKAAIDTRPLVVQVRAEPWDFLFSALPNDLLVCLFGISAELT